MGIVEFGLVIKTKKKYTLYLLLINHLKYTLYFKYSKRHNYSICMLRVACKYLCILVLINHVNKLEIIEPKVVHITMNIVLLGFV
jgi:hypothetical protein